MSAAKNTAAAEARLAEQQAKKLAEIVASDPQIQKTGDPVIDRFRSAMLQRSGRGGFVGLTKVLKTMDTNGNQKLSPDEFFNGLQIFGLQFPKPDMDKIFKYLDRDRSGCISVSEFIRGVRPEMSMPRKDLVMQAYKQLDTQTDGKVTVEDIKGMYDASKHPEVLAGKKTVDQVLGEFLADWDKDGDGGVSPDEFINYYSDISAGIDNDVYFELMIRNAWHLSGGEGLARNTSCMRVNVFYNDGRCGVVEVKNDLGLKRDDLEGIRARLQKQGVQGIKKIEVKGSTAEDKEKEEAQ